MRVIRARIRAMRALRAMYIRKEAK